MVHIFTVAKDSLRRLLPNPLTPVPKKGFLGEQAHETALSIAARHGEGSVLLSAGKIDMTGVDFFEDESESEAAAG